MNKKLLTVAIAGAMAAPMTAQAVKYKLSGQVNRAIVFMDDGVQSDVRNVDSISSGTRFRFKGSEDLGNGMKVGFYWELQTSSSPSNGSFPDQNADGASQNTNNIRQANVWFSGNWGKLSMGQLDGAGNGGAETTLDGTAISGTYATRTSHTGGIRWRTSGGGLVPGFTAGTTYSSFDGFSRYDGVRYDTPALGPVVLSTSIGNDQKWEVAARASTAVGGGQLSAALFYGEATGALNVEERWGGSASFLFAQGTSITGHYTTNEPEGTGVPDADSWRIALGHKWGPHAASISYGEAEDVPGGLLVGAGPGGGNASTEDSAFQIGYVHSLKKVNTQLYASYTHQELDHNFAGIASAEDIDAFVVGARVRFD